MKKISNTKGKLANSPARNTDKAVASVKIPINRTVDHDKSLTPRTNWYAFKVESMAELLKKKPLYFRVEDAVLYGVPAAVLLNNLAYWIVKKRRDMPNFRCQALSASALADILPFSRSTIQRALKRLVDEGVLLYRKTPDTTQPTEYCFAHTEDLDGYAVGSDPNRPVFAELEEGWVKSERDCVVNEEVADLGSTVKNVGVVVELPANEQDTTIKSQKTLAGSNPNGGVFAQLIVNPMLTEIKPAQARIQQMGGSNPNIPGSNPNELGSNPNDYTILINPLENPFGKDCLERCDLLETRKFAVHHIHSLSDQHRIDHNAIASQNRLHYN
jgi:hypothetical protein